MGFMMGKSSKSTSTSNQSTDSSYHPEDRKVAQQGRDVMNIGQGAKVDYRVNGFTGKDLGDMFAGLTHDSPFASSPTTTGSPTTGGATPGNVVDAGGMSKPLLIGAGVLVLGLVVVLAMRKR